MHSAFVDGRPQVYRDILAWLEGRSQEIAANVSMEITYSIRLTRGAYVVSREDAERVLRAVEAREPHVLVEADTIGDGLYRTPLRVVTAHVMSVAENSHSLSETATTSRPVLRAL